MFACEFGGNERSNSIFEILHEVEISHGQETPGILEAAVIWNPNSVDEVHNGSKDMWGALIHLEILVVVPNCSVELLQCLEVLGPGIEDNLRNGIEQLMNLAAKFTMIPGCQDKGVGLDELPLAIEGDVGIVSVLVQVCHLGHEVAAVKAHVFTSSWL